MSITLLFFKVGFIIHILIKNCCIQIQSLRTYQSTSFACYHIYMFKSEREHRKERNFVYRENFIYFCCLLSSSLRYWSCILISYSLWGYIVFCMKKIEMSSWVLQKLMLIENIFENILLGVCLKIYVQSLF